MKSKHSVRIPLPLSLLSFSNLLRWLPVGIGVIGLLTLSMSGLGCEANAEDVRKWGAAYSPNDMEQNIHFDWSLDGEQIILAFDSSLYSIRADGTDLKLLTGDLQDDEFAYANSPDISPDGSWLAFSSYKHKRNNYQWEIVTSDLSGSGIQRLTDQESRWTDNVNPLVSPNGQRIAFLSSRDKSSLVIYTMARDGSDQRRLAIVGTTRPNRRQHVGAWSPDSQNLAFITHEVEEPYSYLLFLAKLDGSEPIMLDREVVSYPTWSPDGSRITYLAEGEDRQLGVYSVSTDGSPPTMVKSLDTSRWRISMNSLDARLSYSHDGTKLLISGHNRILAVMDANGQGLMGLGLGSNKDIAYRTHFFAKWAPDDSRIAVMSVTYKNYPDVIEGNEILFTMKPDMSDRRVLVRHELDEESRTYGPGPRDYYNLGKLVPGGGVPSLHELEPEAWETLGNRGGSHPPNALSLLRVAPIEAKGRAHYGGLSEDDGSKPAKVKRVAPFVDRSTRDVSQFSPASGAGGDNSGCYEKCEPETYAIILPGRGLGRGLGRGGGDALGRRRGCDGA